MASAEDTKNRKADCSQVEMDHNQRVAEAQRYKTSFRAAKVSNDKYNPIRLSEAISDRPPNMV